QPRRYNASSARRWRPEASLRTSNRCRRPSRWRCRSVSGRSGDKGVNAAARAIFPFSVESVAIGYGSATASEETRDGSRAELWLPLWEQPATLAEVRHLFAEGRAQLGRRQARNAVEFVLAVNLLGVSPTSPI